jgi:hypothetical protein
LNSTHASAPLSAPISDSSGNIRSAIRPTPSGDASQITIGFALMENAARAVALTTCGLLSVSAVITKVSPGLSLKSSLVRMSAALPSSYSYRTTQALPPNIMTIPFFKSIQLLFTHHGLLIYPYHS